MKMIRKWSMWTVVVTFACLGCGKEQKGGDRLEVFPVSGEVFVDGDPAQGAMVFMHPDTPHQIPEGARPVSSTAQVDENGKFEIATYGAADGAPAGKYKVTIIWEQAVGISGRPDGPDKLRGRYSNPQESKIEVEVAAGPVTIPRIELKSR